MQCWTNSHLVVCMLCPSATVSQGNGPFRTSKVEQQAVAPVEGFPLKLGNVS